MNRFAIPLASTLALAINACTSSPTFPKPIPSKLAEPSLTLKRKHDTEIIVHPENSHRQTAFNEIIRSNNKVITTPDIGKDGLSKDQISTTLAKSINSISSCHNEAFNRVSKSKEKSNFNGYFIAKIDIAPTGEVNNATISQSNIQDEKLKTCVLQDIKTWQFPTTIENTHVTLIYPFIFEF